MKETMGCCIKGSNDIVLLNGLFDLIFHDSVVWLVDN